MKSTNHAILNLELLEARATPAVIASRFDAGLESWTTARNDGQGPGSTGLHWVNSGGKPGGYATATDIQDGHSWFWVAPAKFLGNHSDALGRYLTFDEFQTVPGDPNHGDDVFLSGGGIKLALDFGPNPGKDWTSYAAQLTESGGWTVVGTGRAPTAAEFRTVLGHVSELRIRGEYSNLKSRGGLDNVVLGDSAPSLSMNDVAKSEGGRGEQTAFKFTATLSHITSVPVTVSFATRDGTALAGSDYAALAGTLVFSPGQTTKSIKVEVQGDKKVEGDETFFVSLSNAVNATLSRGDGTGLIINDD